VSRALKAHLLLVVVTFIWGATFILIKNAVQHDISPLLFNLLRMTLATAALALIFHKDVKAIRGPAFRSGALVGTFMWVGYEFQTTGIRHTTASKSAFITGISVVLVPLFLSIFWRRIVNHWSVTGVACAFMGLFLLTVPAGESALGNWTSVNLGDILTFICAIGFAFQIIFLGRATERHPLGQIAFLQIAVAALWMAISIPFAPETPHLYPSKIVIWAIVITGLFGTAAAFSIQAWAQQFTSPTHTALIFSLEPVFAWITSYIALGERLGPRAGLGAAMILAGVVISELLGTASLPRERKGEKRVRQVV
jgi:drug/metabolite transporter (DMT)-like permease